MRTFVISRGTGIEALRTALIDRRISAARANAAIERLRALNPHVDLERAGPGTVILVPDGPEFASRATGSPVQGAADELRATVETALKVAAEELKAGLEIRAKERSEVKQALDNDAFRRAIANDRQLQQQAKDAARAMAEEEAADRKAPEQLDATSKASLAALNEMRKLTG